MLVVFTLLRTSRKPAIPELAIKLCHLIIFLGKFFEVLIGARPEPLWRLLCKLGVLYALEPVLTVIFVTNLNTVWEKVMSTLRAQIFRRVLIQKVKLKFPVSLPFSRVRASRILLLYNASTLLLHVN